MPIHDYSKRKRCKMYKMIPITVLKRTVAITGILLLFTLSSHSQIVYNISPDYYSVPMKRLLALYVGNYINQVSQAQLDIDSSTMMACQVYQINRLLPYNEEFDGSETTEGMILINSGKITKARNQLSKLRGDDKVRRLFELGTFYLFKPQNNNSDLDSAKQYFDFAHMEIETYRLNKWINASTDLYGKYYSRAGDLRKGQLYFQKLVDLAVYHKDSLALANALFTQADYLPFTSPDKLIILQRSLFLSRKFNLNILQLEDVNEIFTVHFMLSSPLIEREIAQILKLEKLIGFRHLQYAYSVSAFIAETESNNLSALNYAQEAYDSARKTGDNALISINELRMAEVLCRFDDYNQAIIWYQKALSNPKHKQYQVFWYINFIDEVQALIAINRNDKALALVNSVNNEFPPLNNFEIMEFDFCAGLCYDRLGNFSKAELLYQASYKLISSYPPEFIHMFLPDAYIEMAHFYFKEKKYNLCRSLINKIITANAVSTTLVDNMSVYSLKSKLDSINGNFKAAFKDYQIFKRLSDIQNNTQVRQKYNLFKVQFATVDKDRNIKLLKQANELQNTRLKEDNYFRKMTIGAIILITIIAVLLYYLYRSKKHVNLKLQNQQKVLESLIVDKDWLVKEIHHRVKNNLHTIVSLLESQTAYLQNDDALAAVRDSQHRVHAMSLIHQKLYMGNNMTSIKSADYIKELVNYLKDSFDLNNKILFDTNVEQIELDVAQTIPIGLIINEVITNSIKYAFDKEGGKISISLKRNGNCFLLRIEDNGRGLPKNFDVNDRSKSLGMSLISGLTKEIGGQFDISGVQGTCVSIQFPQYEIFTKQLNGKGK